MMYRRPGKADFHVMPIRCVPGRKSGWHPLPLPGVSFDTITNPSEGRPGGTCCFDDAVVSFEDELTEPLGAELLRDVFDGAEFGRARGQKDWHVVDAHVEVGCYMPSGQSRSRTARTPLPAWREISRRCNSIASVWVYCTPVTAPVPRAGQLTPNRRAFSSR